MNEYSNGEAGREKNLAKKNFDIVIEWRGGYPMPLAIDGDDYFDFDITGRVMEEIRRL